MAQARPTLHLLGGVDIHGLDRGAADGLLGQPKVVALLSYLAIEGADGRWHRRDALVGLLWPELDQTHARAALRKGVHALRSVLGPDALASRGDEELRIGDQALGCDVVEFGADLESNRLLAALERYRGDLMPGFHLSGCAELDRWLDDTRTELRERASAAAWALAQMLGDQSAMTEAGLWAKKAVRYSWSDERTLRRALSLMVRGGDRAGALHLYDEFARRLKADLDALPSAETVALVNQIRG
ncbi:MAG: AfsR/SARP family transcriptional regulator [bacterium]